VITLNVPVAASFEKVADAGDSVTLHAAAPSCVTATAWPPTVSVPVRDAVPVFAVSDTVTVPGPTALAAPSTCIHPRSDAAVHAQAAPVVTVTDPVPPVAANDKAAVDSVNVHAAGGAGTIGDLFSQAGRLSAITSASSDRGDRRGMPIPVAAAMPPPARIALWRAFVARDAGTP
jgi:hypothetical protein